MPRLNPSMFVCKALLLGCFCSDPPIASAQLSGPEPVVDVIDMENSLKVMEARSRELVERLKEPDQDAVSKQALREELLKILLQQFSEQEAERLRKVEAIEQRIKSVKSVLQQRAKNAERIVEARIAQLLGEPSEMAWDFSIDLPADELEGERKALPTVSDDIVARWDRNAASSLLPRLSNDLLLGYGLVVSNVNGKKEELAALTKNLDSLEKKVVDAHSACLQLSQQLTGQDMNDPKLSSEYQKAIDRMGEAMRDVEEMTALVQSKKRELQTLEMQLLPLSKEVETRYPSEKGR